MIFKIERVTYCEGKPCDEAILRLATYLDYRTAATLKEAKKSKIWYKGWYNGGIKHREENGLVVCDVPGKKIWVIEINNIIELLEFMGKYNSDIILEKSKYKEIPYTIIIYDDYIE